MTSDAAVTSSGADPGHSDVFISYAREDQSFVRRLTDALGVRGKRTWVDWADIPPTAEWMAEIKTAIEGSDTYVVVLSPASLASKVCAAELDQAKAQNKRIVPILAEEVDSEQVPDELGRLNWVVFASSDFDGAVAKLVEALETDLGHVRGHTRLLVKAGEWEQKGEDKALLVRGGELTEAEAWLAQAASKTPATTPSQTRFLIASRRAASRRQRGAIAISTGVAVLAAALGVFAWQQRSAAVENERLAVERARQSRSRELAAASVGQLESDPELSLLLAMEARESAETAEAIEALRLSLTESRVRQTLTGHQDAVVTATFSADGAHLLTASYDGTARIWNLANPDDPIVLSGHQDLIQTGVLSHDGSLAVTTSFDGTARVWEADGGAEVAVLQGHRGAVHDAVFNADGTFVLTGGDDGTARIWDAQTGELLRTLRGHDRPIYDIDVSSAGSLVVTASDDDTALIWDMDNGRKVHSLAGHDDGLYSAAFDPRGRRVVTASEDGTAKVWDARTGRVVADLTGSRGPVVAAAFSPDGQEVVAASEDSTARIWEAASGRQIAVLRGHRDQVNTASFSPDGRSVVTSSLDGSARVWAASDGSSLATLVGHTGPVATAGFAPEDGNVVTGGDDGTVRIWEPLIGRRIYEGEPSWGWRDANSDRVAIASFDGSVRVIDASTGTELWAANGPPQTSANFSADGSLLVSGAEDGVARVWDASTGELVSELRGHDRAYLIADFWDTDRVITWSDDGTTRLWDPRSGDQLQVFDQGSLVWEAHLSPDTSKVFTTGGPGDGTVRMWDADSGELLWDVGGLLTTGGVGAGFSPDGRFVGTAANEAEIWDADSGERVSVLEHPGRPLQFLFSPDGSTVLTRAEDGAARTFDPRTGRLLTTMPGHPGTVNSAMFSEDGRWIATTADDGLVRIWEASSGLPVTSFAGAGGPAASAFFSGDGQYVISLSRAGVRADRCEACATVDELATLAGQRMTRDLTQTERREFLTSTRHEDEAESSRPGLVDSSGRAVTDGVLESGEYGVVGFDPGLTFMVPEGWFAQTFLDLQEGEELVAPLVQLQPVDRPSDGMAFAMLDPGRAIDGSKDWDERRNIVPIPADMINWLSTHPHLETKPPSSTTVGGVEGRSVVSVVTSVPENSWLVCGECATPFVFVVHDQTGPLTLDDVVNVLPIGELDRWIVLETGGHRILVNYWSDSEEGFRDFSPIAEEILESVVIGQG